MSNRQLVLNLALSSLLAAQSATATTAAQPRRVPAPPTAPPGVRSAVVTARNPIDIARGAETLGIAATELQRLLGVDDPRKVQVLDSAGQSVLSQPIDLDDDGKFDELIFQADFGPRQARTFTLVVGNRQPLRVEDFKAYGRFVRERRDDFAWENDRIAHRMYGAALETWAQEPLTSSAVDVWTKRVRRLVINDWYMLDDYHQDNGTGGDFYSAGTSRGCGGNGIWANGRLYASANFRGSRVLANGPIRVMFELMYEPWDAGGTTVSEVKRITLDAGQNLGRYESFYSVKGGAPLSTYAAGIKKSPGSATASRRELGVLRTWEPMKGHGNLGCGVIVDPPQIVEFVDADGNHLVVARVPASGTPTYYAGFGWDRSGDFATVDDWDRYLEQAARRLRAPIEITLDAR